MKKFISVFLCFVFIIVYFILVMSLNFTNAFSKENINKAARKINITETVKEEDMTEENKVIQDSMDEVYNIADKYNVSKETIDGLINSEEAKSFIASYMQNSIDSAINGKTAINSEQLNNDIKKMVNEYLNNRANNINSAQKEKVMTLIDENSYKLTKNLPSVTTITNKLSPSTLKLIQTFFSNEFKILLVGILIFSIISITLLQLKKLKWMLYLGTTLLISNILVILFGMTIKPLITFMIDYNANIITTIIKSFTSTISNSYLILGGIGIIVSIILLVIYKTLHKEPLKTI